MEVALNCVPEFHTYQFKKVWALLKQQTCTTIPDCLILQILNWPNMDSSSDIAELP